MILSVNRIKDQSLEKYDVIDQSLIASKDFIRNFGDVNDYVEAHIYTKDNRLLESDYRYRGYKIPTDISIDQTVTVNSLIFDPASHLQSLKYNVGDFKIDYKVYRKKIFDLAAPTFFINEISNDRKEIRIVSNIISDSTIESNTLNFIYEVQTSPYFKDFLLNFGENKTINAINIALDKNSKPYSIVIKLYQPLPSEFDLKSSLWIVEELADPIQFEVELILDPIPEVVEFLGPVNFNVNVDSSQAASSTYESLNSIYSTNSLTAYQNVVNKLQNSSININVNYSDYSNFIHFSSATERLNNFVYKLESIEGYQNNINILKTVPNYSSGSISASIQTIQNNITGIIQKFDGYESYLYNISESNSWPKVGTYPNYTLLPTTSSQALYWLGSYDSNNSYYGGMSYTSSVYDLENQDNLVFSVPEYISTDQNNEAYLLFLNMIGQHFDNIWVYIKAINDIHKANNSFTEGISKDMVYTALRSLGIKLYNNNTNNNIFNYLIGNTSGSYTITGSHGIVSGEDQSKELFKRIYHNLPYLLKSKGTNRGIRALISTFGIPDTLLDVIEYGGSDKSTDTLEYSYERFSYGLNVHSGSNFDLKWAPLTQNKIKYGYFTFVPDAIELKFKPDSNNINNNVTLLQQFSDELNVINFGVTMNYTSSNGIPSANFNLYLSDTTQYISSSLTLPVYATGSDGDTSWWNLLLRRNYKYTASSILDGEPFDTASIQQYDLIVKNNIGGRIGAQASASIYATGSNRFGMNYSWSEYGNLTDHHFLTVGSPSLTNLIFPTGSNFNGNIQEVRYWSEPLSNTAFDSHVLNGESYEGNNTGSAFNDLAARFPLGNNLVTYNHSSSTSIQSVHPNYIVPYSSGSIGTITSISLYGSAIYGANAYGASGSLPFVLNENKAYFFRFPDKNNYNYFYNINYANAPNSGYYAPVTEKIRIVNNIITSDVLSPTLKLEIPDTYRTNDVHFTDVSFSPQNEINKDIIAEYGSTLNIDNLIGNPSTQYDNSYVDLNKLNTDYYKKFASKYNLVDFIRLIKSVDNTLFKMIEDFVPARTNLSTGITIKSPILERNKVQRQKPSVAVEVENDAILGGITISSGTSHVNTNGSTEEFITSQLSGSLVDVWDYFKRNNYNPYLFPSSSVDTYTFEKSAFNTLQGVANTNATSNIYLKVDENNPSITSVAEIQDGYYKYKRHSTPRYLGSKSTSQLYNVYTVGDSSYGKNAAIDYNVLKFAFTDTINTKNLNFYNKTTVNLKYLVNQSSSLTELNINNKNLFEVQNTFKSGDQVVVSLFDKLHPTNQSNLNGSKEIFLGGFSYTPILFRDLAETLDFKFLNPTVTESVNLGVKAFSTSSYDYIGYGNASIRLPSQPPPNTGGGYFYYQDGLLVSTPIATKFTSFNNYRYATSTTVGIGTGSGTQVPDPNRGKGNVYEFDILKFATTAGGYNTEPDANTYKLINGSYCYLVPRSSNYAISGSIQYTFIANDPDAGYSVYKIVGIVEKTSTPLVDSSWTYVTNTKLTSLGNPSVENNSYGYDANYNSIFYDGQMYTNWNFSMDMISTSPISLTAGQYIRFKFYILDINSLFVLTWDFRFTLQQSSYFEIYDVSTKVSKLLTTGSIEQIPELFIPDPYNSNKIIFNDSASFSFYTQSIFVPHSPYVDNYTPVTEVFEIYPNDLFRFGAFSSPSSTYYEVDSVTKTPNVSVTFKGNLPSASVNSQAFAILRKVPDETSVILNFNKLEGATSKALLIPNNLYKPILDNVANIIQPLKSPLSTQ